MTAYKLTETWDLPRYSTWDKELKKWVPQFLHLEEGRVFIYFGYHLVLLATPTQPQLLVSTINISKVQSISEEINLLEEYKLHPHLYKPLKKIVYESLEMSKQ